ncbi:outer membrane beta-barrel protein [Fulvivirga ligni]|uniref:outer membrane beta-barrel protein n=1 Tax=Fulvivirga ligni TaxID=2904246 RepID=UPI001F465156|nr:outer membrane beta-barrel protein [Fulvivirga ligni]UII20139.1 porin family protein [Fulvivirga ligni]
MNLKAFILIIISVHCFNLANAQTEKGSWMVGGNVSGAYDPDEYRKELEVQVNPNVGYFFVDKLMTGISISDNYIYRELGAKILDKYLVAGPEIRYYFGNSKFKFFPYVKFLAGKGKVKINTENYAPIDPDDEILDPYDDIKYNITDLNVGGGLSYFFKDNIAVEILLSYSKYNLDKEETSFVYYIEEYKRSNLSMNIGFQIYL